MLIARRQRNTVTRLLQSTPIVALLGPRQCGKTTLARMIASEGESMYFDLEDPRARARLQNPTLALSGLRGLVVIDEIQRQPELFEILRVLVDDPDLRARFLLLGSASPTLVAGASESLAGRVAFVDLAGFDISEVEAERNKQLWLRGGFPRSFLADSDVASLKWRDDFVRTFLERDLPQLGIQTAAEMFRRFWTMIAHLHGQVLNVAEFARALGRSENTARHYLDVLSGTYVVRQLPPWHENLKKRQVKAPKIYVRDSGLLHALLTLGTHEQLASHPKLGASWEGFAVEQIVNLSDSRDIYFWATHAGAELDLLLIRGGVRTGFEMKYTDSPRTTRSMRVAIEDLGLDQLYVVHPGPTSFDMDTSIRAVTLRDLPAILDR